MSSTHKVIFQLPKEPCNIYMVSRWGYLPKYYYFDNNGRQVSDSSFTYSNENITRGGEPDAYGNKPVTHYYLSGSVNLAPLCLEGAVTTKTRTDTQVPWTQIIVNDSVKVEYVALGPGKRDPGMCYYVVTSNTSDLFTQECYRPGGELESTMSYTCVSISVSDPWHYSAVYKKSVKFAPYGLSMGNRDYESLEYVYSGWLLLVGKSTGLTLPKATLIDRLKSAAFSVYREPIVPDTITDDIFSKFAVPDVNNCENLMQLKDIKNSIPPILKLVKKRNIKSLSELYLWYKYTYKTTMLDFEAYYKFFKQLDQQSKSRSDCQHISLTYSASETSNRGTVSQVTRYNLYTNTYNGSIIEMLGLDLNMSNTWDMIPFSFVVDWFVNIGDVLATLDHSDTLTRVNVFSVLTSNKCISTYHPFADLGILDAVTSTMYSRELSDTLPVGNLSVSLKNPSHHIIDGAALIFANKR